MAQSLKSLNSFDLIHDNCTYSFRLVDLFNLSAEDEKLYVILTQDFEAAKGAYGNAVAQAFYYASFAKPKIAFETIKSKISEAKSKTEGYQRYDWFVFTSDKFVGTASVRTPDYDLGNILGGAITSPVWELSATVSKDFRSKHITSNLVGQFVKYISQQFPTHVQLVRVNPDNEMVKHLVTKHNFKPVGKNQVAMDLKVITMTFDYDVYVLSN